MNTIDVAPYLNREQKPITPQIVCYFRKRVLAMLEPDYDWESHDSERDGSIEQLFRLTVRCETQEGIEADRTNYYQCGSITFSDSKALYKILGLLKPPANTLNRQNINLRRGIILTVRSSDKRFLGALCFYNNKLVLCFYSLSFYSTDPDGYKFFGYLTKCFTANLATCKTTQQ